MAINYNPNLPPNDSLEPWEIRAKVAHKNFETKELAQKAYEVGGVPPSIAERLNKIIAKQAEIREAINSLPERQVWQEDYEAAEINQFAESCLPQRPALNLNHINIEWEDEK